MPLDVAPTPAKLLPTPELSPVAPIEFIMSCDVKLVSIFVSGLLAVFVGFETVDEVDEEDEDEDEDEDEVVDDDDAEEEASDETEMRFALMAAAVAAAATAALWW